VKGQEGVLFSTGGIFEGLSLFIKDDKFQAANNTGTIIRHLEADKHCLRAKYNCRISSITNHLLMLKA
jgi:arylsulfatase